MLVKEAIKQLQNLPEDEDIFLLTLRSRDFFSPLEYLDAEPSWEEDVDEEGMGFHYPVFTEEQHQQGLKAMQEDWSARLRQLNDRTIREYETRRENLLHEISSIFPELSQPWEDFYYDAHHSEGGLTL